MTRTALLGLAGQISGLAHQGLAARGRPTGGGPAQAGDNDTIEDILITLHKQYHLIRLLNSPDGSQKMFLYLVLDRDKSNLALARHRLTRIEKDLQV